MAFLDEIAARLVAQGVGVLGTNIFGTSRSVVPPGDGPFLSLTETGGTGSAKTQNDTATERPTAQILARAKNASDARAMLINAYVALGGANGLYNVSLSGRSYLSIIARQTPTDVGLDDAGRIMYSFNVDVEKAPE